MKPEIPIVADGVEKCKCGALVQVFKDGNRRIFMAHYIEYPEYCHGQPKQETSQ